MYTFLVILAVITAVLLAIVVLIQESKGGGLASNVSGANSVLGVRQTTNFIEKATWTLAALLVVFSVATSFFAKSSAQDPSDVITNSSLLHRKANRLPRNKLPLPASKPQ